MKEYQIYLSLFELLYTDKPLFTFIRDIVRILEDNSKDTLCNIGIVIESTARLKFLITDPPFDILSDEEYQNNEISVETRNLPSGYKWRVTVPLIYQKQKKGVLVCLGKRKRDKFFDTIGGPLGLIIQEFQLKKKLIKDTMLMNTIIMSVQTTASSPEIYPLVDMLYPHVKSYLSADDMYVIIWEKDGVFCVNGIGKKDKMVIPSEKSIILDVKTTGRALMLQNTYENADFNEKVDALYGDKKVMNLIASPISVAGEVMGVLVAVSNDTERVFVGSELVWVKSICGEIGASMERLKLYHDIHKLFLSSVEALTAAIEGKDPYTHGHSRRVTMFSLVIGKELGLDSDTIEDIRLSGLLHDIGKIVVPESILTKPGKLSEDEWYSMKQHPVKGVGMLEHVKEFVRLLPGIKHHHERYDGSGYPDGLKGENIPLIARIISLADAFDAMTSKRIYREALTETEALEEIKKCSGKQFDPEIAGVFIKLYNEKFYTGI